MVQMPFTLYFTNVDNGVREFETLDEAVEYGRRRGFEFSVWHGIFRVASWNAFGGLATY